MSKHTINFKPLSRRILNPVRINTEGDFPVSRELEMSPAKSDIKPEIAHYLFIIRALKLLGTTIVCTLPALIPSEIFNIA
jgi:hypothetical protein